MSNFPNRAFETKFDEFLKRIPLIGKGLASLFGLIELYMLEFFRKLDTRYKITSIKIVDKYLFKGRWGGKVIPLNINLNANTRFLPSQEILSILERSNVVGIAECYCRSTQRKYSQEVNCNYPLNTCIHLSTGKSLYNIPFKSQNLKQVSKTEIEAVIRKCDENGLIHQLIYFPNPQFYYVVCNCCPCCCVVLSKFLKYGSPQMIKSDFIAHTNVENCKNCGKCVKWCYFGARQFIDGKLRFDHMRCFGCGICVSKCPEHAISLKLEI